MSARYHAQRQELGGTIVLGLEFLVAADIIKTPPVQQASSSARLMT